MKIVLSNYRTKLIVPVPVPMCVPDRNVTGTGKGTFPRNDDSGLDGCFAIIQTVGQ